MRRFSTQSMRGDFPTLSMTIDSHGRNTLTNTSSSHSSQGGRRDRKGSVLTLLNTDGVQDPLRLRNVSI